MMERVLALALLAASGVYVANAWMLPLGTPARPGAGSYPLAVGLFGAAVALAWVVAALRRAPAGATGARAPETLADALAEPHIEPTDPSAGRRVAITAGLLVAFCWLLPLAGYPIAAFLFVALLLRGLGARWAPAVLIAAVTAATSHYAFGTVLGVPLPAGALFG
jgi:putative tricarboxylic transport membrane protein